MKARLILSLCAVGAAIAVVSCSPGIGNNPQPGTNNTQASQASTNLPVGLDIGLQPTDPIVEPSVTGVVVPAIGAKPERDLVLLAFATAANAADGDGSGTPLSRDTVTDSNGASDIFLAAVCAQDVDTRVFSQSLAGKFRHPRCATCHSMQRSDTLAFVSSATSAQSGGAQPHAGPPPGPTFPNNDPETCIPCHINSTAFPVDAWQAPAASFDLRSKTVAELAVAAQNVPADETEHFVTDPRVLWALDSGVLPTVGGRNGVADDDHDGIDEPSDRDGIIRTVPGGSAVFIQQIEDWHDSGNLVTAAAAVADITLVSRAASSTNAGNGASSAPQIVYVPNGSFTAPGTVGTIFVVYQSDASDLVAGDGNGATDIFRTAVDLVSDAAGNLDLVVSGNATAVSATNGTTNVGDRASTMAVVGGTTANLVAFQSLATDLVATFTDANGAGSADIYLRNIGTNETTLISHQTGNQATGGDGASTVPSIDATGVGVAFESDATDLIADDTNGVRDVFYVDVSGTAPFTKARASVSATGAQGSGGISADASIYVGGSGRTFVAFESDKTDLATGLVAATNVYLYDSASGATTLLNQILSTSVTEIGDGSARNPVIGADGANVAFESDATNIDVLRQDGNGVTDVFLADIAQAVAGSVLPYRFSLTTVEAADGDGASTEPRFSTFSSASSSFSVGFATYTTAATNLGTADSTNLVVAFLDETSGVLADFTFTPSSGVAPLTVAFTDASTGVPTEWQWDFDNDSVIDSTEQNPSYTYTTPGTYSVKLIASNAVSSNEITKTNVVRAVGTITPDFTASTTSGPASLAVTFTDTSTEQPTAWLWAFGDGTSSTTQNPSHTYTTPGIYTVALTATNEAGSATETKNSFIEVFTPVVASFTATPTSGSTPLTVNFDASATTGATSYAWTFGDGDSDTGVTTSHIYTAGGTFTAELTATGPGGTDTATTTISAAGSVTASFTLSATSAYPSSTISLDASASTGAAPLTYEWDLDNDGMFDDATGVTVTGISVGTQFPLPNATTEYQPFDIRLRVTASGGGQGITSETFTSVAASITATPITANKDTTIYDTYPNNCNPANASLACGRSYHITNMVSYGITRALMTFDVASNITPNSDILSAAVTLECTMVPTMGTPPNPTVSLHRPSVTWGATGMMAGGVIGPGPTGAGTVMAAAGDATWNSPTYPSPSWTGGSPGSVRQSITVAGTGSYTWTSNANLIADVQEWVSTTAVPTPDNSGWILIGGESAAINQPQLRIFASSENTIAPKPQLQITYRPPLLP